VGTVTAPFGVIIDVVTDRSMANVVLDTGTTSAVGGHADGVLGCTTDAGAITLIQGWNWYTGSDASAIGASQYDFQTIVTHELGHALGLGHSSEGGSVMYATLGSGSARRSLAVADLNIPDSDNGACGLHAATMPTTSDAGDVQTWYTTFVAAPVANEVADPLNLPAALPPGVPLGSGAPMTATLVPAPGGDLVPLPLSALLADENGNTARTPSATSVGQTGAYVVANTSTNESALAANDAVFTTPGQVLWIHDVPGDGAGSALTLGDAANLYVDSIGNLLGTVS
jgi:hypothetical protein